MEIVLNIPDELAGQMLIGETSLTRTALEALALEGYRSERLSEADVRRLLGFETRMDVHAFLKGHETYLHYSEADLDRDIASGAEVRAVRHGSDFAEGRVAK